MFHEWKSTVTNFLMFFEKDQTFENSTNRSLSRSWFSCFFAEKAFVRSVNIENTFLKCHLLMVFSWKLYNFLQKKQNKQKSVQKRDLPAKTVQNVSNLLTLTTFDWFAKNIQKLHFGSSPRWDFITSKFHALLESSVRISCSLKGGSLVSFHILVPLCTGLDER